MDIDDMQLSPVAEQAARIVLTQHPGVEFTSGRRDVRTQAQAMATNVVRYGATWLDDTYRDKRMVRCLMSFAEEYPEHCRDAKVLGHHFYEQLQQHFAGELTRFPHIRGDAFDIRYPRLGNGLLNTTLADQIMRTIRRIPSLEWATDKEGKLVVIHAQFKAPASVEI